MVIFNRDSLKELEDVKVRGKYCVFIEVAIFGSGCYVRVGEIDSIFWVLEFGYLK